MADWQNFTVVIAQPGKPLYLGKEGENEVRQVVFDISGWVDTFGAGVAQLIAQRMGDASPYPCDVERIGNTVVWTITSVDTAKHGSYGKCELSYHIGDKIAKSETYQTIVSDAMGEPSDEVPEPYQSWVDQVLSAGSKAEAAASIAGEAAENAAASAEEAKKSAEAAAPTVTVTPINGGTSVEIKDVNGLHTFRVMDGADGKDGLSIYASSEVTKLSVVDGYYTINYDKVNFNGRVPASGDLIVTASGQLCRIKNPDKQTSGLMIQYLGTIAISGAAIYYSTATFGYRDVNPGDQVGMSISTILLDGRTIAEGDLVLSKDGYLWSVVNAGRDDGAISAKNLASLKGPKGDTGTTGPRGEQGIQGVQGPAGANGKDGKTPVKGTDYWTAADKQEIVNEVIEQTGAVVKSVNGKTPDANGNVEIEVGEGGVSSWDDLTDKPFYEESSVLLEETDATEFTDPNFGAAWKISEAPMLMVGETYTVVYNGVKYDCVCRDGEDTGLSFAKGTFAMGNFSVVGGANTGEPFAILVFPGLQIVILDLTGATAVRVGIRSKTVYKIYPECLPMDEITAAVIAALPIYNGEVEDV